MRKIFTPFHHSLQTEEIADDLRNIELSPQEVTLNNILQFAASYRTESIPDDCTIEYCLN